MFKKTKVRSILELPGKNLSAREVSKVLGVSRNTVAKEQTLFLQSGRARDDISDWDDDRLYELFYPDKFKYKPRYAPVDYSYVHKELKKTGVMEKLLWEEYCARCEKDGINACYYITFAKNYKKFTADKITNLRITPVHFFKYCFFHKLNLPNPVFEFLNWCIHDFYKNIINGIGISAICYQLV